MSENIKRKKSKKNKKIYFELFETFFKIGLFTFGGGYAMIPLIQHETVNNKKWITDDDMLNVIAISESTPGPIAINSATFIGNQTAGFFGALCATLGVVLPSFVIILIISGVLDKFSHLKAVQYAFFGIRAGVLALVIKALVSMYTKLDKTYLSYVIIGISFVCAAFIKINVLLIIIFSAALGLIVSIFCKGGNGK